MWTVHAAMTEAIPLERVGLRVDTSHPVVL
jgi:hypothetical protein